MLVIKTSTGAKPKNAAFCGADKNPRRGDIRFFEIHTIPHHWTTRTERGHRTIHTVFVISKLRRLACSGNRDRFPGSPRGTDGACPPPVSRGPPRKGSRLEL